MGRMILMAFGALLVGCPGGKDVSDSGETGDTGTGQPAVELHPVFEVDRGSSSDPRRYLFSAGRFSPSLSGSGVALLVEGRVSDDARADVPAVILELNLPLADTVSLTDAEVVSPPELPDGELILEDASVGDLTGDGLVDLVAAAEFPPDSSEGNYQHRVVVYAGPVLAGDPIDGLGTEASVETTGDVDSSIYDPLGAADLDGDGIDDLVLLGQEDYEGEGFAPVVDIFIGPVSGDLTSDDRDARHGWTDTIPATIRGMDGAPRDLTGDGYPDLVLRTYEDTRSPRRTPETLDDENETVRLFAGPLAAAPETYDETAAAIWYGSRIEEVEAPGDVDGDGGEDLVLRTPDSEPAPDEYMASIRLAPVADGGGWIDIDTLATTWGYLPVGYDGYYSYYWGEVYYKVDNSMAVGGDANGDGVLDLWLGAYGGGSLGPYAWFVDDASTGGHPVETDARGYLAPIDSAEVSYDDEPAVWDVGVDATGDGIPDMLLGNDSWIKVYSAVP